MSIRVLIAAGGTGGHIFPGIAVARELQRRDPNVAVLFVGTARGLETRVVPLEGFQLELIDIAGLKRVGLLNMIRSLSMLPRSLLRTRAVLRRFRPDLVIGVGGYASGPVLLGAALKGIPTMVIEPNAYPGFTNRVLSRFIRAAAVGFAEAIPYFHSKVVVTGNPVRSEFFQIARQEKAAPEASRSSFHLLIFGGSQGSHAINVAAIAALPTLLHKYAQLTVTHQTGEQDLSPARATYESLQWANRITTLPFIHPFAHELARAHLVICRAGAITLAELTAAGKPAILVPLPTAADDHQRKNAEALERRGAARCLLQSELTPGRLVEEVSRLMDDPARLAAMAEASRRLAHEGAAAKIVDLAYRLLKGADCGLRIADCGIKAPKSEVQRPQSDEVHCRRLDTNEADRGVRNRESAIRDPQSAIG
ncbi:MAG: undecaprenyldiphospho-muramoylpentapeptide beta-N-acetylglucosaminyltransferase [Acidobacteria bacterium]|nr:undecaprenyldiphospho-muramoylpentapeptide beta-N-acetylglucosaminyltransferase [Acidobacteriota bacterium]